jgi:hypothetical protein
VHAHYTLNKREFGHTSIFAVQNTLLHHPRCVNTTEFQGTSIAQKQIQHQQFISPIFLSVRKKI